MNYWQYKTQNIRANIKEWWSTNKDLIGVVTLLFGSLTVFIIIGSFLGTFLPVKQINGIDSWPIGAFIAGLIWVFLFILLIDYFDFKDKQENGELN